MLQQYVNNDLPDVQAGFRKGRETRDQIANICWIIKKAREFQKNKEGWVTENWCFWTMVLEKTRESPLDCKEIQPVHPKGDQSWCSLEGLMLKLKLQYFGHLMQRADSFEKTLMLGKIEGGRRRGGQRMRWMPSLNQWTWVWVNSGSWWWTGSLACCSPWGSQRVGHDWVTELNWICTIM